ncbi:MAG TPA: hypothetical protein VLM85_19795 [Polyangiaceae bacterium]|nr:hypothetical protein [Polyangiaceae bacterium]
MQIKVPLKFNFLTTQAAQEMQALNGMMDESTYLTPDALMTYCATRLRGLDTQVQAAFAQQKQANADSSVLSAVERQIQLPDADIAHAGDTSADPNKLGGLCPKDFNDAAVKALRDAADKVSDPQTKQALNAAADELQAKIDNNLPISVDDFKRLTTDAVSKIQQDLNSGTELSMINLQSLMSQRQSAIQMCTNLIQSLGDQMNKIAQNIGH